MKKTIFIFILIFFAINIWAQDEKSISLSIKQAQDYAINNNKQLQNVRLDKDIAKHQLWEAISQGLPQINANFDYTDYFNYEIEFGAMGGGGEMPDIDITQLDAGDMELLKMLQGFMGGGPTTIKMNNQSTAQLQFSQLVFSGQYISGIQIAKIAQILSEQNVEKTEIDIKESVVSSYYLALITKQSIQVIEENIKNLEETQKQTKAMLDVGMLEPIDVDQIKLSVSMLENTKRSLERNVELSYNILRIQLGLDNNVQINLSDNIDNVLSEMDIEKLILQDFQAQSNINYQMLETQQSVVEKTLDMEKWAYAPNLVAAYSYNQKILTTDFDMTPRHLVTFRMSVPIFSSGMRKSKVEQKKVELMKIVNSKELLEDNLNMQEKQLRYNLISSYEQFKSQKENVELAKRIYKHTKKKFKLGVSTSLDLTQANGNYLQAETNYINSVMELLQAKLSFDKLLNKI